MTNEELKKLSNDTFFDNDTGEIQPEAHRNFNNHLIDHTETVTEAALRNAKEYTDVRETAILAAADAKDETTLRTAKEYADRIVAALAGSAPETLDTLQELAAALGDDPNFSATVMQMIGERVTIAAMEAALADKANKNGDASEIFNASIVKSGFLNLTKGGTSNYMYIGRGDEVSSAYKSTDEVIYNSVGRVVLAGVGDPVSVDSNNMSVRTIWHSENLNPTLYPKRDVKGWRKETNCDNMTLEGTYDINSSEASFVNCPFRDYGQIVVFRTSVAIAQLAFQYASGNLFVRTKYDYSAFSPWRAVYHSGNLKPTYYAQIDPQGGIISKSADWIQSVTWKSDGNGMQCYILPKMAVNLATAHVTKVRTYGNVFKGRAPVVCDELLDGCIVVATPGDNGASEKDYFNISIQGA